MKLRSYSIWSGFALQPALYQGRLVRNPGDTFKPCARVGAGNQGTPTFSVGTSLLAHTCRRGIEQPGITLAVVGGFGSPLAYSEIGRATYQGELQTVGLGKKGQVVNLVETSGAGRQAHDLSPLRVPVALPAEAELFQKAARYSEIVYEGTVAAYLFDLGRLGAARAERLGRSLRR